MLLFWKKLFSLKIQIKKFINVTYWRLANVTKLKMFKFSFSHLKTVVFYITLSLAYFVKEKDKIYFLVHILKHSKLSQKNTVKTCWKICCKHKFEVVWPNIFYFCCLPILARIEQFCFKCGLRAKKGAIPIDVVGKSKYRRERNLHKSNFQCFSSLYCLMYFCWMNMFFKSKKIRLK